MPAQSVNFAQGQKTSLYNYLRWKKKEKKVCGKFTLTHPVDRKMSLTVINNHVTCAGPNDLLSLPPMAPLQGLDQSDIQ